MREGAHVRVYIRVHAHESFQKNTCKKMYNFFTMKFFFDIGRGLEMKHKLTLGLVVLGILANGFVFVMSPQIPFVEILPDEHTVNFSVIHIVLAFSIFVKSIVLWIFRKI